jgi:Winged helix DNA-binding domain
MQEFNQSLGGNAYLPNALIFADSEMGARATERSVLAIGGRIGASLGIEAASARLDQQAMAHAIMVDLTYDHGRTVDRLLDRIDAVAERENMPAIISAPIELIDQISACTNSTSVTVLCQPDASERVAALSLAWSGQFEGVRDSTMEMDSIRLRRLADEVTRIARALSSLSSGGAGEAPSGGLSRELQSQVSDMQIGFSAEPMNLVDTPLPKAAEVRTMLRLRRLRESFFDASLFADPAWDMLLDLLAAKLEGDQVAVSSLCIAASVPPTTALRWIKAMTDHGLFERHADPMDGRRIFIRLSDLASRALGRYFSAARKLDGVMV